MSSNPNNSVSPIYRFQIHKFPPEVRAKVSPRVKSNLVSMSQLAQITNLNSIDPVKR